MSVPRDHHFIPAFYLSKWTKPPDGKMVEYTIKNGKLIGKPVGPRSTGYEKDLYSFPELPPESAQYLEQEFFNYLDDTAARALDIHLGGPGEWTNELVNAWSRFVLGIHLRHPDAMPELSAAAKAIWEKSGPAYQEKYAEIRQPDDPESFDELLASGDPLADVKMRVNLIIKSFDNETVVSHLNKMHKAVVDVSASPHTLLLSDRPVCFSNLIKPNGVVFLPISPTKLFVSVNDEKVFNQIRLRKTRDIVKDVNSFVVGRARRFVWSPNASQESFIRKYMSKTIEPTPLFPSLDRYETPAALPVDKPV
jgi:hypothetical protein